MVAGNSVQSQILSFRTHWISNQLPSSETYGVYQDRKGYLWIRTDAGLCRSNGRDLKILETKDGKSSFGVYALAEDPSGRIWFSTSDDLKCLRWL